jgi:3-oxoacyl-[acyl-carrier-protein] synthase II
MQDRVVITGIGSVSTFGVGHRVYADALLAGATGIDLVTGFDTDGCRSHRVASLREFDPARFIPPMKLRRIDQVGRVALACAKLALEDADWPMKPDGHDDLGVALGTYTAGLDSTVAYMRGMIRDGAAGAPALLFSNTVSNAPASLCAMEWGLRGPNVTFNQREASSLAALAFAVAAIRDGRASAMLTGGADRVDEVFFKTHDRFRALSPKRSGGDEAGRPFDRRRNGFVLGEGGFILVLESGASAHARGARVYGEVLGIGATSSPTSINAWPRNFSGLARAMREAVDQAGLTPAEIHAIFAAANGSPDLDALEAAAIRDFAGPRAVPVTSLKGAIGEMGAAGAAAITAGVLTMATGRLPPTSGWEEADPACAVNVSRTAHSSDGDVFLVNSVASGGAIYSVAVKAQRHLTGQR